MKLFLVSISFMALMLNCYAHAENSMTPEGKVIFAQIKRNNGYQLMQFDYRTAGHVTIIGTCLFQTGHSLAVSMTIPVQITTSTITYLESKSVRVVTGGGQFCSLASQRDIVYTYQVTSHGSFVIDDVDWNPVHFR